MCVHYVCALTGDLFTSLVGRALFVTKLYSFANSYSSHDCAYLITAEMAFLDKRYDAKVKEEGDAVITKKTSLHWPAPSWSTMHSSENV